MMLVCAVGGRHGRESTGTALRRCSGCSRTAEGISRRAFASPATATASTAAPPAAATPLAGPLAALRAISCSLTRLNARLEGCARLRSRRGGRSARCGLSGMYIAIPIARRPSLVIAIVVTSISVAPITAAPLSLGSPAITVTAPLTAFRAARLPGVLASTVTMSLADNR